MIIEMMELCLMNYLEKIANLHINVQKFPQKPDSVRTSHTCENHRNDK